MIELSVQVKRLTVGFEKQKMHHIVISPFSSVLQHLP
jgi:hypothetical protein